MIDLKFTAERIKRIRQALGLTQQAFGARLGVDQSAVAHWESGDWEPSGAGTLERLLDLERQALEGAA